MAYTPLKITVNNSTTPDATPVDVDVTDINTGVYNVFVTAASGNDRMGWQFSLGIKLIAGTATILGTVVDVLEVGDAALSTATCVITASGGAMRITITGIATPVDWVIKTVKFV